MKFIYFFWLAACLQSLILTSTPSLASAYAEMFIDNEAGRSVLAGKPSEWEFRFSYMSTGEIITDYEPLHTKYMHLFVVSQDLKEFSHLHPVYDPENHNFKLTINSTPIDGDNFSQRNVITRAGEYHIISEVQVKDSLHPIHGMHFVDGVDGPAMGPLPDVELQCDGKELTKHMDERGEVQAGDSFYRIEVSCRPVVIDGFLSAEFKYDWKMLKGGRYIRVTDFSHWLHMTGHAMAVSLAGDSVGSKVFKHMHNMAPHGSTEPLVFNLDREHGSLRDGAYKVWAQFKRAGKVLTLPVVVDFKNESNRTVMY